MKKIIHFNIWRGESMYVAECSELAVVTQGRSIDETVENIKEALSLHIEGEKLSDYGISESPAVSF